MPKLSAIGDWKLHGKLGEGGYSVVRKAVNQKTQQKAAAKIIDVGKQSEKRSKLEAKIHSSLDHPHITKVYEVVKTETKTVIVMELFEGKTLYDSVIITSDGLLAPAIIPAVKIQLLFYQLLSAVHYAHERDIVHRDLKLQNVMVNSSMTIAKITDFGLGRYDNGKRLLKTFCGTPRNLPPEIIAREPYSGKKADVWGLGIILYSMLTLSEPFVNIIGAFSKADSTKGESALSFSSISPRIVPVLKMMLDPNPAERATTAQILENEWVQEAKAVYEQFMLTGQDPTVSKRRKNSVDSGSSESKQNNIRKSSSWHSFVLFRAFSFRSRSKISPTTTATSTSAILVA